MARLYAIPAQVNFGLPFAIRKRTSLLAGARLLHSRSLAASVRTLSQLKNNTWARPLFSIRLTESAHMLCPEREPVCDIYKICWDIIVRRPPRYTHALLKRA